MGASTSISPAGTQNSVGGTLKENTQPLVVAPLQRATTDNLYEVTDQYLVERLSRRVIVKSGTWHSNDGAMRFQMSVGELTDIMDGLSFEQASIFSLKFPHVILGASKLIDKALCNIAYFRANVRVNLRVQATPFQQGVLWMYQAPVPNFVSNYRSSVNEHMRGLTSFPGVELNLQDPAREIELVVPFACQYQVLRPQIDNLDEICSVVCSPIVKLNGVSLQEKCSYTVTANFEDIKLYGLAPVDHDEIVRKFDEEGEDEKATSSGLISGIAGAVSTASGIIGEAGIPMVSSIAKAISWPASVIAGVAKAFGMSKTIDLSTTTTVCNTPARCFTHTTGVDGSMMLGSEPNNAIDPTIVTFDKQDEMCIGYISSRPYVNTSTADDTYTHDWNVVNPVGTVLAIIVVHPFAYRQCHKTTPTLTDSIDQGFYFSGNFGYIAAMCNYWRGTMVNTIKFAKTQYHSGRILVQYYPYVQNYPLVPQAYPLEAVKSQIIDLAAVGPEGVEVTFPTVVKNAWLKTYAQKSQMNQEQDHDESGGYIVVSVLNPLVAPITVSQTITMYTVARWENAELAFLGTRMSPLLLKTSSSVGARFDEEIGLFDGPVGDGKNMLTTMGEALTSTRAWIKRFTRRDLQWAVDPTPTVPTKSGPYYSPNPLSKPGLHGDYISLFDKISLIYRFWHGSVRYKFYFDGPAGAGDVSTRPNFARICLVKDLAETILTDDDYSGMPQMIQNTTLNPVVECAIPYFSASENLVCGTLDASIQPTALNYRGGFPLPLIKVKSTRNQNDEIAYVAAGDDFGFTFMIGAPPFCFGKSVYPA